MHYQNFSNYSKFFKYLKIKINKISLCDETMKNEANKIFK